MMLAPDRDAGPQQLPAPSCVFDMAPNPLSFQLHLCQEAVGPAVKYAFTHLLILHCRPLFVKITLILSKSAGFLQLFPNLLKSLQSLLQKLHDFAMMEPDQI